MGTRCGGTVSVGTRCGGTVSVGTVSVGTRCAGAVSVPRSRDAVSVVVLDEEARGASRTPLARLAARAEAENNSNDGHNDKGRGKDGNADLGVVERTIIV